MIGCSNAGKTSLSKCYQKNKPLEEGSNYIPTVSLDYYDRVINMNGKNIYKNMGHSWPRKI